MDFNEMYCSQQICIPPSFPYILRQYAKAAIRSQPTDLLRWSSSYFRCLSFNITPPVKIRLEYPSPKNYVGITPGWLKTILYQLQNNQTCNFLLLWNCWTGACLKHDILIQILCIGGFTDNQAIPLLKFLALCAAHLTDNLTQTMILICEILTEEPEGGSAMIEIDLFLELYRFIANIDASKPQHFKNFYFTDSILNFFTKKTIKTPKIQPEIDEETETTQSTETILTSIQTEEILSKKTDMGTISCPSIKGNDNIPIETYLKQIADDGEEHEENYGKTDKEIMNIKVAINTITSPKKTNEINEMEPEEMTEIDSTGMDFNPNKYLENGPEESTDFDYEMLVRLRDGSAASLQSDELNRLDETFGEMDEMIHPDIFVEIIPGIGPIVPEKMIDSFCNFMRDCAARQHGMIMPRNLRFVDCPPLEMASC